MATKPFPMAVIAVVADALAAAHTHTRLDNLFYENGAPGDPPVANKLDKCMTWLKKTRDELGDGTYSVVGGLIEEIMESEGPRAEYLQEHRQRIEHALKNQGLLYHAGGKITVAGISQPTISLEAILRKRDLGAVADEFERITSSLNADPAAAVTAACALLEALCKTYIDDENLQKPNKETLKPLWSVVQKDLGLAPGDKKDEDVTRILSGLTSIVDGIAALRTHAGSAHGRGRSRYRLEPRHARFIANSAFTVAAFLIETWHNKKRN